MRYVIAAMLACLLVACGTAQPVRGATCSTKQKCEIERYLRAP
jgi:hypothetical protein